MATIDLSQLFPEADDGSRAPLPKQQQTMDLCLNPSGPQFIAYYGGYGSGKSLILCAINIMWGVLHGGEYAICRQFMPELRRTTFRLFKELLPKGLLLEERVADAQIRIRSQRGEALFHFVGLDEPGKLDSLTLDGVSFDEASQTSEEAMLKLQGRLRGKKGLRKMLLVGNPKGHDFVYKYFVKKNCFVPIKDPTTRRVIPVETQKNNYKMIIAPSTENTHLPPGYVAQMMATYSPERVQRDIMGSFDAFQGQIYSEFDRNTHVIPPFNIPTEWTRFIGGDHGFTNPSCFLWCAMDYDGNTYVYREFYEREWIIDEICRGKKDVVEGNRKGLIELNEKDRVDGIWIDPSTQAKRDAHGSHYDSYLEHLPKTWSLIPANNAVTAGIDRIKEMLKPHPKTGKPSLFIFDTCSNLIDELIKYRWAELPPGSTATKNDKEEPVKKDDHSCDALRYAIMSRPEEPKKADLSVKKRLEPTLSGSVQRELHDIKRGGAPKDIWGEQYGTDPGWHDPY